ncbi:MAG: ATPase AAA [Rhodospirillaceae bacterium BRH_c57]|nr:MAG: ATPase AAA [Rhodospirillaceae bacterium BRH_c57]
MDQYWEDDVPFINDKLEETRRLRDQKESLDAENAALEDVVNLHLAHRTGGLKSRFQIDIDAVVRGLRAEILGQDQALEAVEDMLNVIRADITDPRRPLFTALFLGPTGVGKTEIVRSLARSIHGDADAFCRIDMNTLSQEHYSAALTGAPPGYVGAKEGKTLFDQEKIEGSLKRPGIVLFDELEKASPQVLQALLNVFDNGQLTVASGERTYSFRNALVFMTSNLGARDIQNFEHRQRSLFRKLMPLSPQQRQRKARDMVYRRLLGTFPPEFVNRIDHITVFNWIEPEVVNDLVRLEIERLNRRLLKHGVRVQVDPDVIDLLVKRGFDRQFGARSLRRAVRRHVEVPVAKYLLRHHRQAEDHEEGVQILQARRNQDDVIISPRL